jgi:phage-related protein
MKLGSAMGISTKEAVESLTLGIGRQSKLILDNLGITFQASDAYAWYAEKIGKSVSELTESEKKLAWQQYAIKRVTEEARKLGDNISQTQIQQQQWNAQLTNFKTALGRVLSPLGGLISATKDFIPLVTVLATTNLPALISSIKGVGSAFTGLFSLLMAHPLFLVIAAVAALALGLIHLYNTCEPFRQAVDAIGQTLMNVFKAAIDAVVGALQWLWDTISNNPLAALLAGPIGMAIYLFQHWNEIVAAVHGALQWLWDTITGNPLVQLLLAPLTMLVGLFQNWDRVVQTVTGALRWLWNILRPVADLIGAVANALGSVVGWLFGSPKTIFEDAALGVRKLKRELRGLQFPAFPAGAVAAAGGGTVINVRVDAQGAVFTDDYDVDRFMDRVVWRLRREVG